MNKMYLLHNKSDICEFPSSCLSLPLPYIIRTYRDLNGWFQTIIIGKQKLIYIKL